MALYARGFGADHAHTVVGNLVLVACALLTAMAAWYVFKEVGEIGCKMVRVVLMAGVVAAMVSLLVSLFAFVYPTAASREAARVTAKAVAERASNATTTWFFERGWRSLLGAAA